MEPGPEKKEKPNKPLFTREERGERRKDDPRKGKGRALDLRGSRLVAREGRRRGGGGEKGGGGGGGGGRDNKKKEGRGTSIDHQICEEKGGGKGKTGKKEEGEGVAYFPKRKERKRRRREIEGEKGFTYPARSTHF